MHYAGHKVESRWSKVVELARPNGSTWNITLTPLPLGFPQRLLQQGLIPPVPPTKVVRKEGGRIQRNEQGQPVTESDIQQREYQVELSKYHLRVALLAIKEALRNEKELHFETIEPSGDANWISYVDQLGVEFEQAGFTWQDILWLCDQIQGFQQESSQHLQQGQGRFFSMKEEDFS